MAAHKHIDRLCAVVIALCLLFTVLFMNGEALGLSVAAQTMGYEDTIFSTAKVHTIDIVIDDWDAFLSTAVSEEYSVCDVTIDGETVKNVGIRGKGNTSLSNVAGMDSDRYSFKIEFDQYDSSQTYQGLDKLCLNNLIQDNTYMKDYLVYQMMGQMGVAAPLCSYANITVNGEDWGLYLAVEAVEDSFLRRNYGSDYGELYKPDSMSFGGGRGNGKDFDMGSFMADMPENMPQMGQMPQQPITPPDGQMPDKSRMPQFDGEMPQMGEMPDMSQMPENFGGEMPQGGRGALGGGMGASDVKLQYIDDDPESYANIFDNAKTDITDADKTRLIASLKQLSAYENLENVVDAEAVLAYFAAHNFVVNGDSYTGSMIHNYYLYEKDGKLAMIPWDYNLAFGTFQGSNASNAVNEPIDEALEDRPMQAWIFSDETYTQQYYYWYSQLLSQVDVQGIIEDTYQLILPYVTIDPTAFCTEEEFRTGVDTLRTFCELRAESVERQLYGSEEAVEVGDLNLSAMGTMGHGMGGRGGMEQPAWPTLPTEQEAPTSQEENAVQQPQRPNREDFTNMRPQQQTKSSASTIITVSVTVLVLALGLLIAFKFKQ